MAFIPSLLHQADREWLLSLVYFTRQTGSGFYPSFTSPGRQGVAFIPSLLHQADNEWLLSLVYLTMQTMSETCTTSISAQILCLKLAQGVLCDFTLGIKLALCWHQRPEAHYVSDTTPSNTACMMLHLGHNLQNSYLNIN